MKLSYKSILLLNFITLFVMIFSLNSCKTEFKIVGDKFNSADITESKEMEYYFYLVEGNKYKTLGYYTDAVNAFTKCLEINPTSGAVNYELANIYVFQNDFSQAVSYSENSYNYNPKNVWYGLLYANILDRIGEKKSAIKVYEKLLKDNPENTDLIIGLADFYAREKQSYRKAIDLLNSLEKMQGMTEELFFEKERIYIKYDIKRKIVPEIKKLVDAFPDNNRYLGLYAERLMNAGEDEESFRVYTKLLELDPDNPTAHISFGEYYLKKDSINEALSEFKQSIGNPDLHSQIKVSLILNLSGYYGDKIATNEIESLVDLLIVTHPNIPDGHALKAELLISQGNINDAANELIKVLNHEKENYLIWEQLISIDSELGHFKDMYNHSKEASLYFPNYPKFLLYNGFACSKLNKVKEGIEVLDIGLDMIIDQPDLEARFLTSLADLYYKEKQYKKSFDNYEKAIIIQPTNAGILNNYSYFLALQNTDLEMASKMAKLATEISPDNSTYLDTYAWVLYKIEKYSEAEEIIIRAIKHNLLNNPVIIEHYGDILFKTGKKQEAISVWKEAAKAGKGSKFLDEKIESGQLIE